MNNLLETLWDNPGKITIAFLAIILLVAGLLVRHEETVTMPEAYRAWVKLTGNSNHLEYAEWRALVSASRKSDSPTFIILPTR